MHRKSKPSAALCTIIVSACLEVCPRPAGVVTIHSCLSSYTWHISLLTPAMFHCNTVYLSCRYVQFLRRGVRRDLGPLKDARLHIRLVTIGCVLRINGFLQSLPLSIVHPGRRRAPRISKETFSSTVMFG
jgi:hypothetical protein